MTEHTQQGSGKQGHEAPGRSDEREGSRPDGTSRVERKSESEAGNLKSREHEGKSGQTPQHTRPPQEQRGGNSPQPRHSSDR